MGRGPTSSVASSTIVQPVGSQTRATILSRALASLRQVNFTADSLKDPAQLYEVLHRIQQNLILGFRPIAENPMLSGNLLRGVTFSGGQTLYLGHGLGRAYQGYFAVRAQGGTPAFEEAALPAGATPDRLIGLTSTNAGTFDLWVF